MTANRTVVIKVYNRHVALSKDQLITFDGTKYKWKDGVQDQFFMFDLPGALRATVQVKEIKSFKVGLLTSDFEINSEIVSANGWQEFINKNSSQV